MASSSLREKLQTLAEMPGQPSCQRTQLLDEITDASLTEFQNTGDVDHLQRAVTLGKEAVESTHYHNDSVRVRYLGNLGLALQMRNHSTGSLNDINEAIAVFQNAIQLCDPGNTDDMFLLAANLGTTFLSRFLCTGSVQDLQDSIARTETALKTVPPEHRGYLGGLCTIAEALHERFELLGSMHDINRCLTIYDDIYKSMPIDHSYYLTAATKYGDALLTKSRRTPEIEILDRTIGMLQLVVECSRQTDSNRAGYLDRLGAAFELRSTFLLEGLSLNKYIPDGESTETADELEQQCHERMSRAEADIEQSITYLRESAELILENSPAKSTSLNTLGVSLTKRFAHTRSIIDINDAIAAFEGAVRSTPDSHPSKGIYLTCLGTALEKRSEHSMSRDDLRRASEVYALTAGLDSAPPKQRIFTARLAVKLLEASDIHSAYNLLRTSVELLPSTSPHGIDYRDQQNALSFHGGLASDSAALALECGKRPADAASLLDAGRGIILGRSIDIHSDVKGLPEEVAERYNAARALLDRPFPPEGMPTDRGRALQDEANIEIRHRAALAFGQLTKEIRELEGFHEFGLPLSPQKLMEEAIYGPVVIINVNSRRSDAFLVTDSAIHNQPLPNLKPSEVERQVELFRAALKVIDHPQKGKFLSQINMCQAIMQTRTYRRRRDSSSVPWSGFGIRLLNPS
jgi:tetratricopeptide (TPR) repeat protein